MILYQNQQASIEHPERCEDALLALQQEGKAPVFVVIDGMGGHQRTTASGEQVTGREAAQYLRGVLSDMLANLPPDVDASPGGAAQEAVVGALRKANRGLLDDINHGTEFSGT